MTWRFIKISLGR